MMYGNRLARVLRRAVAAACVLSAAACGHAPPGAATHRLATGLAVRTDAHLTDEEVALMKAGLLPASYPALVAAMAAGGVEAAKKLARQGLAGPFSAEVGDPTAMLAAARFAREHAAYARFLHGVQPGDVVLISPNDPKDFVATMTGGPFDHVLLCTDAAPPGLFIEAIGVTGEPGDTNPDRVRRMAGSRYAEERCTLRVVRPGAGRPAAVAGAIAFATAQLGKPYNYTFSDQLGGEKAYYCSSLAYKAYQAAGVNWPVSKDPARDRLVMAIVQPVMALEPEDPLATSLEVMTFLHRSPAPTHAEFADFVVNRVLPRCRRTAGLAITPDQRAHLAAAIARVLSGDAFPRFERAAADYQAAAASGAFNDPVTGPARRAAFQARMAAACVEDGAALVATSDINTWPALRALQILLHGMLPYADDLSALFTGPHSAETRAASRLLDLLDALRSLGETPKATEKFGPGDLPGRAPWVADRDFVSPTDLAWSSLPHEDYNARPGAPVDPPWPYAVVPENGHFGVALAGL